MDDRSTDTFGPVKKIDSVEEEEEPEEEQENDEIRSIFEEKGEAGDDKPDYDRGNRYAKKWGMISKNFTWMKSSSSWIEEDSKPMLRMPPSMTYYLYGEEGYKGLT